jgi:hypothetical protein
LNARSTLEAEAPFPDGHLKSFFDGSQVIENGRALGGTPALLEDHGEPARRGSPISQHRLRKQRSDPGYDFLHLLILPRKRTFLLQCLCGKPIEFEQGRRPGIGPPKKSVLRPKVHSPGFSAPRVAVRGFWAMTSNVRPLSGCSARFSAISESALPIVFNPRQPRR